MARKRAAVANAAAVNDLSTVATTSSSSSSSSVPAFDSQASISALQKHVTAVANGLVGVPTTGYAPTAPTVSSVLNSVQAGHLYAASASQLVASQTQAQIQQQPLPQVSFAYHAPAADMSTVAQPQQQPPATPNGAAAAAAAATANLDSNMTPGSPGSQDESSIITDGRRGPRRELSTSKRAAQNRAAQRAFRQRKEGYIKKLEQQVREFGEMESQFKHLQAENFTLREYVIHLQSKIIDLKAEMPQPPANLNLSSVSLGHNLSGASAAAAAASLLSNAANAAALQRQQEHQQHAAAAAAAAAAGGYTPASAYAPAAASDPKNESSLARMAQAVAQFETGTVDAVAAAAAAAAAAAGAEKTDADAAGDDDSSNDPMDTTPEAAAEHADAKTE